MDRRIIYVQFTNPAAYPPLEHSSALLADRGWEVLLLGAVGKLDLELPVHSRLRVRKIRLPQGGWSQKLQYLFFFCWVLLWTWRLRPRWIYASDPFSCPVVWWTRKIFGLRVVYHEHDTPDRHQARGWFMRQVLAYREKLAREAEVCILPQRARLRQFLEATGRMKPAFCVWNCPRLSEVADRSVQDRDRSDKDGKLIIYYHGSITPDRLPAKLILAAARLKGVRVRVAGYETLGSTGHIAELTALATRCGAGEIVECLGTIPLRTDLLRSASTAHVGLSLMPKRTSDLNIRNMVGASNKPFDYMACGLPLLVSDLPEWVSTFVESGFALACDPDDPDSIEAALRWYLEHPEERRQMGLRGREKIQQAWNYEAMFADGLAEIEYS
jgi:glycosyltransferase involved in cell wall biosynthesis